MKTNFDNITKTPESLAKWWNNVNFCCYCKYRHIGYLCKSDKNCEKGLVEWLKQPLPMSEQFTDEEIEYAFDIQGYEYIARDKNGIGYLYKHKPDRKSEYWLCKDLSEGEIPIPETMFKYLKWEDEPIALIDIINSRKEK